MYDELVVKFMRDKRETMEFPQGLTAFQVGCQILRMICTLHFERSRSLRWLNRASWARMWIQRRESIRV